MAHRGRGDLDYKSLLQQKIQRQRNTTPTYKVIKEKGPDHYKQFLVVAQIENVQYTPAWGHSKKEAEQRAASNALAELGGNSEEA